MASRKTRRIQRRLDTVFVPVEGGVAEIPTAISEPKDVPRMLGEKEALDGLPYGDPEVTPEFQEAFVDILILASVS